MEIDISGGGSGGFKMKKGMFVIGLLLEIMVPLIAVPFFLFIGDIEKMLGLPGESSGALFYAGIVIVVGGALLGALLLFGAILIPLFSMMGSKNRVLSSGVPAEAKILELTDTGTRINHNPLVNFTLEVRPATEQPFQAQVSQTVSVIHLPSYQPGKLVNVRYIPGEKSVAIVGAKFE
ncbi:MAG: hypothetical protein KDB79_05525 [Acidobacteria bacterium]|nr:hypothetical protein [Acidobacteriota bacterium]